MIERSIRHHSYIETVSAETRVRGLIPSTVTNAWRVEMLLDFAPLNYPTMAIAGPLIVVGVGSSPTFWFEMTAPVTDTTPTAAVRTGSSRLAAKYSADGAIVLGERTVLRGIDDGTNVRMTQDGVDLGPLSGQADWTNAQKATAISLAGNWDVGFDSGTSLYTLIRLYEYWLKVNDKIVVHWRPVVGDDNPLPDLSVYGITGAIETAGATSAEDTDYLLRSAYNEAVTP